MKKFLALLALAFIAYGPMLFGPYVYDDVVIVEHNSYLRSFSGLGYTFKGKIDPGGEMDGSYRPLLLSFFSIVGRTVDFEPAGLRIWSVILHATVAALLYGLAVSIFSISSRWAFFSAALFALHPIQSTNIGLIWKQSDIWMGLLTLLSLLLVAGSATKKRIEWLLGAFTVFVLAFGFKESAMIIPCFWLLLEPLLPSNGRRLRVFVAAFGILISYLYFQVFRTILPSAGDILGIVPATRWQYFATQLDIAPLYLRALIWPNVLTIDRAPPLAPIPSLIWKLSAVLILIGVSAGMTWLLRRRPKSLVLLGMAAIWLVPTSTFQPLALIYDETRLYLTLGFGLLFLATLLAEPLRDLHLRPALLRFVRIAGIAGAIGFCWNQADRWETDETFWKSTLAVDARSPRALYQLGLKAQDTHALDDAEVYYKQALLLSDRMLNARLNLGIVLGQKGDLDGAADQFRALLKAPGRWAALGHYHLGLDSVYRKDFVGARSHFLEANRLQPGSGLAEKGEAIILTEQHRVPEAQKAWRRYLEILPLDAGDRAAAQRELSRLAR